MAPTFCRCGTRAFSNLVLRDKWDITFWSFICFFYYAIGARYHHLRWLKPTFFVAALLLLLGRLGGVSGLTHFMQVSPEDISFEAFEKDVHESWFDITHNG